ncbi:class I SAM-dependent methyltransferase [uncultured Pelagimonas sp.]|uniref:class I SAM-dependent methyltransferase n=1 Tax=uncultured Pelagimonas sp. TaxID=1618102 RepID=UPI00262A5C0B|nr:class I SAM-dependent methyltransferase [uncultured Pelagimonas sp.]
MSDRSPFFILHSDLPREGPGCRADLDKALSHVTVPQNARILDAGCGPGADIDGLLAHAPQGHVTAVDGQAHFIAKVTEGWGHDTQVTAIAGDMLDQTGPFDLIWSAGALYFLGIERALAEMGTRLTQGGALVFSELVYLVDDPAEELRIDCEAEYPDIGSIDRLKDRVVAAGYQIRAAFPVSDEAWEEYYTPMDARVAKLRDGASAELAKVLDEGAAEAAIWRKYKRQFGYVQIVAVKET